MKRAELEKLGLEKEVIDKIMDMNGADINKYKGELETTKEQLTAANEQITSKDAKIEELSKVDAEQLQATITKLKEDNAKSKADYEAKIKDINTTNAIKSKLTDAQDVDLVASLIDKTKLGQDLAGLDEQIKGLKESKAFLFKSDESKPQGFEPNTSGKNCGGTSLEALIDSYL